MTLIDLSTPMRQSPKGILIIFSYNLFKFIKKTFILLIATVFSLSKSGIYEKVGPLLIILSILLVLAIFIIVSLLRYYNFKFSLKNNEFYLNTGILNKETVILPKSKIQNVYIKESFLHRLIGVVSLNIESAGDTDSEIEINAIDKKLALRIKEKLFQESIIDELPIKTEARTIFQVSVIKLFLEGLTQNHLKSLLIIFGFVVGLYFENKDFIEDYDLKNKAIDWLNVDEDLLKSIAVVYLILLLIGLIISVIYSTLKMVLQNFNLTVKEYDKSIEISKGLLQTMTLTLLPNRIQNIDITTNRLKKKLGLHTLKVKQAMASKKQANKLSVVGLDINSLEYLKNNLIPLHNSVSDDDKNYSEDFYKRVLFIRYGFLVILINIVLALIINWYALATLILSLIILIYCVKIIYNKSYYYFDSNFLTKGSGLIETRTNILELHKIQSVSIVQNILHKRRGLGSLYLYTASQKTIIPFIKKSNAELIADFLIYKVESTDKDWM